MLRFRDTDYFVTNDGKIYREKIIKPTPDKDGYEIVSLWKNNKRKSFRVHRMVAELYLPNPHNKPQVNHKDGNKTNNKLENLEWATASENNKHKYRILKSKHPKTKDNGTRK